MLIKFSRKKWWAIENSWFFEHWYTIYRKVFLCFYKKVGDVPIHFFNNCKDGKAADALLEQTFQTKGEQHEEDPRNNGHRYGHRHYKHKRCRKDHSKGMPHRPDPRSRPMQHVQR